MHKNASNKILIVAAEASSCLYALRLLQHWKKQGLQVEAFGIGDKAMEAEGFQCIARAEDLAVVGLFEVISHWSEIKKAFYDLETAAKQRAPKVVLLLDYPGFNLRFAKRMKSLNIPVVYYISPQVWAWKTGRVKTIKATVDKMLVILPFEVEFYKEYGIAVEFVGHPLLDELSPKWFDDQDRSIQRARYGLDSHCLMLALMPGSRKSELKAHMQTQLEVACQLHQKYPRLRVALFVAPNFEKEDMQPWLQGLDFPLMLIKDEPFRMIHLPDVVLCASGTATLMVGLLERPMVIMYRMSAMTAFLAKRFVTRTRYFGLINLVLNRLAVPELFQEQASVPILVSELEKLLDSRAARDKMSTDLREAKTVLGSKGATERVARIIQEYWTK